MPRMSTKKPILIIQLRPEDVTSDSEYQCILKYGGLQESDTKRLRIETHGIPDDLNPEDYSAIIVGGSPFDITTPADQKSAIQNKIEAGFMRLLEQVVTQDLPFLGACSGNGLLGTYLGAPMSRKYGEPIYCTNVAITEDGKQDKLLAGFPDEIDVLLGHKEAVDETREVFQDIRGEKPVKRARKAATSKTTKKATTRKTAATRKPRTAAKKAA